MDPRNILEVKDVQRTLTLGGRSLNILRGISFTVVEKEWIAFTGPSGSGKSTLLGVLAGIDRPDHGQVFIEGEEVSALPEGKLARLRNRRIGLVFQAYNLIPTLTAQENVEAPLYIGPRRKHAASLARQMLERVGLTDRLDHRPHQLSGGEQQRVAIARALVTNPGLLLADEPTGNLDSATSKQILDLLRQLRDQFGLTVIMVTHDTNVAAYADRRLHLVDGCLADGQAENIHHPARQQSEA